MFDRLSLKSPVFSGNDYFAVADTDGFSAEAKKHPSEREKSWLGGMTYTQAAKAAYDGDLAGVERSSALMAEFESLVPVSRRWRTLATVAGGAPNVAAYLAGSPLSMRRRERVLDQGAPLTIFCDVMSSAGIPAEALKKRGAAVLALVRVLGAVRPVTAYMVGGDGSSSQRPSAFCAVRMDNPIDLSRAAFFLGHPGAARGLLYSVLRHAVRADQEVITGMWAWGSHSAYIQLAPALYAAAVGASIEDCLYLAPPHLKDPAITQPAQWIKDMLAKHGGSPMSESD
jgi:hypothetical protein